MDAIHPIRAYRERQIPRLSQQQLGKKIGVTRFTIMRWEGGSPIDDERLDDVVRETGIPAKELKPDLIEKLQKLMGGSQ